MFVSILVLVVCNALIVLSEWYLHNWQIGIAKGKYRTLAILTVTFLILPAVLPVFFIGMSLRLTPEEAFFATFIWLVIILVGPRIVQIFRKDEKK